MLLAEDQINELYMSRYHLFVQEYYLNKYLRPRLLGHQG